MNIARTSGSCAGTNTAALFWGGSTNPPLRDLTESWNGTNWTEVGTMNTGRTDGAGVGNQTSALQMGGLGPGASPYNLTESWNGSTWTEVAPMLSANRYNNAGAGASNGAAVSFGGGGGSTPKTEIWNAGPQTVSFTAS